MTRENYLRGADASLEHSFCANFRSSAGQCQPPVSRPAAQRLCHVLPQAPSLLSFREQTTVERRNLQAIYQIGDIPAIPGCAPGCDYVLVSVYGVEHFSSTKVHCVHCTTRTRRDGATSYHHAGLAAVLIHPAHEEVFPLDFEPILNQDGDKKNDCERNAAKRLTAAMHEQYPDLKPILVEDAL